MLEGGHSIMTDPFAGTVYSPMLAQALFILRVYLYNRAAGCRNRREPDYGTFAHWVLQDIRDLAAVHGQPDPYPGLLSVVDSTVETFGFFYDRAAAVSAVCAGTGTLAADEAAAAADAAVLEAERDDPDWAAMAATLPSRAGVGTRGAVAAAAARASAVPLAPVHSAVALGDEGEAAAGTAERSGDAAIPSPGPRLYSRGRTGASLAEVLDAGADVGVAVIPTSGAPPVAQASAPVPGTEGDDGAEGGVSLEGAAGTSQQAAQPSAAAGANSRGPHAIRASQVSDRPCPIEREAEKRLFANLFVSNRCRLGNRVNMSLMAAAWMEEVAAVRL